jgi:hypothetical protein
MSTEQQSERCGICGAVIRGKTTLCGECEKSFHSVQADGANRNEAMLDLEKYNCRMFPWEPMTNQPALITSKWTWLLLALGLVALVVLLSLLRTPLPSCWEISSLPTGMLPFSCSSMILPNSRQQ